MESPALKSNAVPIAGDLSLESLSISAQEKQTGESDHIRRSSTTLTEDLDPPKRLPEQRRLSDQSGASSIEEEKKMFRALESIFDRAQQVDGVYTPPDLRAASNNDVGDPQSLGTRVNCLRDVREILDQMWWLNSQFTVSAAQVLADGSRDPAWRIPFGEAGIVDFFLSVTATDGIGDDLFLQSLRLIGNSCAETDENRERVVYQNYLGSIVNKLEDLSLAHVTVPRLWANQGREPAQQQAATKGLMTALVSLLCHTEYNEIKSSTLSHVCRLMELMVALPQAPQASDNAPDDTVECLLKLANESDTDLEDYLTLISIATSYLGDVRFQNRLLTSRSLELPLSILVESYSKETTPGVQTPATPQADTWAAPADASTTDVNQLLSNMRNGLNHILSDISALPDFSAAYPLQSPLIGSLRRWLSVPQTQLQVCACIMLGNLARSDDVCATMVHEFKVHHALIASLGESADPQVLHAVAGFLKNLSLMTGNKDAIGEAGVVGVMSRLWSMDTLPQLQYSGAALARQVVSGSYANVKRLLTPLSSDPDSPAHSRTYLSLLIRLCGTTDQIPTKTEVARLITAICRALSPATPPVSQQETEELQYRLYQLHPDVTRPLSSLILQDKWPVIRSEGWFALALMARSREGAGAVGDLMDSIEVFKALGKTVMAVKASLDGGDDGDHDQDNDGAVAGTGTPSEPTADRADEMRRIDRENAMVLISKLLENKGEEMKDDRRQIFEDLLQGKETIFQQL
ncbi:MAG: hypothetical protein M1825_001218 [Sarcosagium campestre]|nr:MAG: hypothetical protein M1825_001218 [Sarcosagium campestre]